MRPIALVLFILANILAGCASEPRIDLGTGPASPGDSRARRDVTRGIDDAPAIEGNSVVLPRDGAQAFPAMFEAMSRAKDSINLEYYTFDNVRAGRRTLGDVLADRLRHGVAVNIIYDAIGLNTTPLAFLRLSG
jgi:phosphatidylserine/phosphatidylglycerophosphate/cardiolipin synthase-like enzyme